MSQVRFYGIDGKTLAVGQLAEVKGEDGKPRRASVRDLVRAMRHQQLFVEEVGRPGVPAVAAAGVTTGAKPGTPQGAKAGA